MATLKELAEEIDQADSLDWMSDPTAGMQVAGRIALTDQDPPRLHEIVQLLRDNLLLVRPTLEFIQSSNARIAQATLEVLYTPEQIEEMKKDL